MYLRAAFTHNRQNMNADFSCSPSWVPLSWWRGRGCPVQAMPREAGWVILRKIFPGQQVASGTLQEKLTKHFLSFYQKLLACCRNYWVKPPACCDANVGTDAPKGSFSTKESKIHLIRLCLAHCLLIIKHHQRDLALHQRRLCSDEIWLRKEYLGEPLRQKNPSPSAANTCSALRARSCPCLGSIGVSQPRRLRGMNKFTTCQRKSVCFSFFLFFAPLRRKACWRLQPVWKSRGSPCSGQCIGRGVRL